MGLFDSVQKGIEKASAETNRMMRVNRLKQQIDGKRMEITQQSIGLANRALELFANGQALPPELVGFCQAIVVLQNQIAAFDEEIRLTQISGLHTEIRDVQSSTVLPGSQGINTGIGMTPPPYPTGHVAPGYLGETSYLGGATVPVGMPLSPDYGTPVMTPAYGAPTSPPAQETVAPTILSGTPPASETAGKPETGQNSMENTASKKTPKTCPHCHTELEEEVSFCQECGRPVDKE